MSDRLSALDASFLYAEEQGVPQHVGTVMVFEGPIDYPRLQRHLAGRIAFVPRYRKRVREVPGRLANPVWVDDPRFDLGFHVRRLALPAARAAPTSCASSWPGCTPASSTAAARCGSCTSWRGWRATGSPSSARRTRRWSTGSTASTSPRWSWTAPDASEAPPDAWRPGPQPSALDLVTGAVLEAAQRPTEAVQTVRDGGRGRAAGRRLVPPGRSAGWPSRAVHRTARWTSSCPGSGCSRWPTHTLAEFRAVARRHGTGPRTTPLPFGRPSTTWCSPSWPGRCGPGCRPAVSVVSPTTRMRALVPGERPSQRRRGRRGAGRGAVASDPAAPTARRWTGSSSTCRWGRPNPVMRLHQVAYQLSPHRRGRPCHRRPRPRRARRASPRRPCTASASGSPAGCRVATSTCWSPTCPGRSSRCTAPVRVSRRPTPSSRCPRGTPWPWA